LGKRGRYWIPACAGMTAGFGRAIAPPQVDAILRIITVHLGASPFAMIDPAITWTSRETIGRMGRLPQRAGRLVKVRRHRSISLCYVARGRGEAMDVFAAESVNPLKAQRMRQRQPGFHPIHHDAGGKAAHVGIVHRDMPRHSHRRVTPLAAGSSGWSGAGKSLRAFAAVPSDNRRLP
jgi:hypothetical protein